MSTKITIRGLVFRPIILRWSGSLLYFFCHNVFLLGLSLLFGVGYQNLTEVSSLANPSELRRKNNSHNDNKDNYRRSRYPSVSGNRELGVGKRKYQNVPKTPTGMGRGGGRELTGIRRKRQQTEQWKSNCGTKRSNKTARKKTAKISQGQRVG